MISATLSTTKLLAPDRRSDCKYENTVTSARAAKIAKYQLRNKVLELGSCYYQIRSPIWH